MRRSSSRSAASAWAPWPRPTERRALPREFFDRPAPAVARDLIGRVLVHEGPAGRVAGRIVEAEAYRGARDPASHAFRGRTARNAVMFGPPGRLYVYFTYGMHHCINLVCEREGRAAAVLIRALEPLEGIALMRRRRGVAERARLARGPGCVSRALGIDRRHDGADLSSGPVFVERGRPMGAGSRVARGPRVGIRVGVERPWRLYVVGHPCVSGPRLDGRGSDRGRLGGLRLKGPRSVVR